MRVSIFGSGYVGLVTGACFAETGNRVTCVDVDAGKIARLHAGDIPIYEPGLDALIQRNRQTGHLRFTTAAAEAIADAEVILIAVGTPPDEDGSADLRHVLAVAETIGRHLSGYAVVVDKSTVPVGTADRVRARIAAVLAERGVTIPFDVVSNPEFLKEGDAIKDFMKPDRIVIGSRSATAIETMKALYAPFNRNHERVIVMDERSAELTKYAANAMLATKISFMNEMSNIAASVGADVEMVRIGIGSDPRIGYSFIYPGMGYGGSCFPKDVQALGRTATAAGYAPLILNAVEAVNRQQKQQLYALIERHYGGRPEGKTFALWGLSFKPNTDDLREAPSRILIDALLDAGARVRAYDPAARTEVAHLYAGREGLVVVDSEAAAVESADALCLVTEWKAFWAPDFERLAQLLRDRVIFDGRNIYDPVRVEAAGLAYYGIGRGRSIRRAELSPT